MTGGAYTSDGETERGNAMFPTVTAGPPGAEASLLSETPAPALGGSISLRRCRIPKIKKAKDARLTAIEA